MAFTVKQMADESLILITYRRPDSTIEEATVEGRKIAYLLREIGDFSYIILDLSGHKNSFQTLYKTIQGVLQKNPGRLSSPTTNVIIVGSSSLVEHHQACIKSHKGGMFGWMVTNEIEHAYETARAKIQLDKLPLPD